MSTESFPGHSVEGAQIEVDAAELDAAVPGTPTTRPLGATAIEGFNPIVEEVGTVESTTLGSRGWERDGDRYKRGDE